MLGCGYTRVLVAEGWMSKVYGLCYQTSDKYKLSFLEGNYSNTEQNLSVERLLEI